MAYDFLTQYNAASYTPGRQGYGISEIVIHHWGNDGQTFEGVISWFENPSCPTSAHAVLEAGRVACIVNYYDTAYHAGNWEHNLCSIGIECRPEMSAGDLETLCEYIADLWTVYGVLPLKGHKDIVLTACPGRYYAKIPYINERATEIYNEKVNGTWEVGGNAGSGNDGNGNEGKDEDALKWAEFERSEEYAMLKEIVAGRKALNASEWAEDALDEAVAAGITTGERPQDLVTREEAAIMVMRGVNAVKASEGNDEKK